MPTLKDVLIRRGGYFTGAHENEVPINDRFAEHHHIVPGQKIRVLLNSRRQKLLVVGTAVSGEFTYLLGPGVLIPDPEHFGVLYIPRDFAEDVFDFQVPQLTGSRCRPRPPGGWLANSQWTVAAAGGNSRSPRRLRR